MGWQVQDGRLTTTSNGWPGKVPWTVNMKLLEYTLLAEPDRQRLARFLVHAGERLRISPFRLLPRVRAALETLSLPIDAVLRCTGGRLELGLGQETALAVDLPEPVSGEVLRGLAAELKAMAESLSPELLRQRNREAERELARARAAMQRELRELEAELQRKRAELSESLRRAETDALTGLLNRGAFDLRLNEAIRRCQRQKEPLSLMLFDLDYFKEINDELGHQAGDEMLRRMARALRDSVRDDVDHCCRFGGDEFACILFADLQVAERVAERVLADMDGRVSIGAARMVAKDTPEALLRRADEALYAAKEAGRGQYQLYRAA